MAPLCSKQPSISEQYNGLVNEPATRLSEVAATLEALRKLSKEAKGQLLLPRLAKIRKQNFDALHKGNLMLDPDHYGLAHGYPEVESIPVREHLLGTPWNWLVQEGYIVDTHGNGFYEISDEGRDLLASDIYKKPIAAVEKTVPDAGGAPRAFLSYSWDSPEHRAWVTALAERLQSDGVVVIFDHWHLGPGQEKQHFMEQNITKNDFVIVICTEKYAAKADDREGGVGYKTAIISSQLAEHLLTSKYIPVLRHGSFRTSLPIYLKPRMGIDLSAEPYWEDEYERLLRALHNEPIQPPPLGKKPDFAKAPAKTVMGRTGVAAPLVPAPTNQRPNGIAYARYDKPGVGGDWITATVRLWDKDGKDSYSFETMTGSTLTSEEFFDSKDELISRFFDYNRKMLKDGYKRMNFTPGPDPDFYVLQ